MRKKKKFKYKEKKKKGESRFALPIEIKQTIFGVILIVLALIVGLSFFNLAGSAGKYFITTSRFLIGETIFLIPLILILAGLVFLNSKANQELLSKGKKVFWPVVLTRYIHFLGA